MKKKNFREEKSQETKAKIYKSAEELFSRYAFHEVSVDRIVRHAGVAKGTFYVHFESKDALISELISSYVSRADTNYRTYLESLPCALPTEEIILSLISKIADVLTNEIGYDNMKTVYRAQISKDIQTNAVMQYGRQAYKLFEHVLETGIRRGELKTELPPDILARHFMMAFRGIAYEWCVRYPDFDLKAQAIEHFRLLISGLR